MTVELPTPAPEAGQVTEPAAPEAPAPSGGQGAPTPEETFAKNFDPASLSEELRPAYDQMRGDYTRKTQELAQQRQEAENALVVQQAVEALHSNDPQLRQQAAEFLGLDLPGGEEEILTPEDELRAQVEALTAIVQGQQHEAQTYAQEEAHAESVVNDVVALEGRIGRQFDEDELKVVLPLAEQIGAQAAYDALSGAYTGQQKRYVQSKRTGGFPPSGGTPGSKEIDFNNPEARTRMMAEIAAAHME